QLIGISAIFGKHAHTNTNGGGNFMTTYLERPGEGNEQLIGNENYVVKIVHTLEHYDKFIAAEPRDCVHIAHAFIEAHGNRLKQYIAGVMAEAIVDYLKSIDVQQHQCQLTVAAPRPRQTVKYAVIKK